MNKQNQSAYANALTVEQKFAQEAAANYDYTMVNKKVIVERNSKDNLILTLKWDGIFDLPGHGELTQTDDIFIVPLQDNEFRHSLKRVFVPFPHVFEHTVHEDQS